MHASGNLCAPEGRAWLCILEQAWVYGCRGGEGGPRVYPHRGSRLIFISKNFFNKKVIRATPCRSAGRGSAYTRPGVFYIGGREREGGRERKGEEGGGASKPPDLALKVSQRSRYFITFLYFEKRAQSASRIQTSPGICVHTGQAFLPTCACVSRSNTLHV